MTKTGGPMDRDAALQALDGSQELLQHLANMFCEDAPARLHTIGNALMRNDYESAKRETHSLKGQASTFFAHDLTRVANILETRIDEEAPLESVTGIFRDLQEQVEALMQYLKSES